MGKKEEIDIEEMIADGIRFRYNIEPSHDYQHIEAVIPRIHHQRFTGSTSTFWTPPLALTQAGAYHGALKVDFGSLVSDLGYTKSGILSILREVRKNNISLHLIGLGGVGMNFLYWLSEIMILTGYKNPFSVINGYDGDKIELSNVFRFPFVVNEDPEKKVGAIPLWMLSTINTISLHDNFAGKKDINTLSGVDNPLFYGAPDFTTRNMLSASKAPFIAATHGDDDYSLIANPVVAVDSIAIEGYGLITLDKFFINQLSMTLKFLELCAGYNEIPKTDEVVLFSTDIVFEVEPGVVETTDEEEAIEGGTE